MKRPFLAYLGPHAPHYSADAPPWAQPLYLAEQVSCEETAAFLRANGAAA